MTIENDSVLSREEKALIHFIKNKVENKDMLDLGYLLICRERLYIDEAVSRLRRDFKQELEKEW